VKQIIKLSLRNIKRHPGKNAMIGIVIFFSALMFFLSSSMAERARETWRNHFSTTFLGRYHLTSVKGQERDYTIPSMKLPERYLPSSILEYLERNGLTWSKRLKLGAAVYNNETAEFEGSLATVVGMDFSSEQVRLTNLTIVEGNYDPSVENGVLVWDEYARSLNWQVGDEVTFFIKDVDDDAYPYTFTITGILSQHHEPGLAGKGVMILFPLILADYTTLAELLGVEETQVMEVAVWDENPVHEEALKVLAGREEIQFFQAEEGFGAVYGIVDFVSFMGLLLESFILTILVVASLNINMMGFLERRREIGAMMAMGAKPRWTVVLLFGEMIAFSTVAFLVSLLVYVILVAVFSAGFDFGELAVMFAREPFKMHVVPVSLLYAYITVAAAMILSAIYPAYLTTRIDPVEVFREVDV